MGKHINLAFPRGCRSFVPIDELRNFFSQGSKKLCLKLEEWVWGNNNLKQHIKPQSFYQWGKLFRREKVYSEVDLQFWSMFKGQYWYRKAPYWYRKSTLSIFWVRNYSWIGHVKDLLKDKRNFAKLHGQVIPYFKRIFWNSG